MQSKPLKTFAHHDSWGHKGFPWDRPHRDWKIAAMSRLVYHVYNSRSLAKQSIDDTSLPDIIQVAMYGGPARPSIEGEEDEPDFRNDEGSMPTYDGGENDGDDEDDTASETSIPPPAPPKQNPCPRTGPPGPLARVALVNFRAAATARSLQARARRQLHSARTPPPGAALEIV